MFAPLIKAPKAKTASQSSPTHVPEPPQHVPWQPRLGTREQMLTLQRTLGNQAMLRLLRREAERPTGSTSADHHDHAPRTAADRKPTAPVLQVKPARPSIGAE